MMPLTLMNANQQNAFLLPAIVVLLISAASLAVAQEGERMRMPRINLVVEALDRNRDGTIDKEEILAASASLAKLDRNQDGVLSPEELRPEFRGGGPAQQSAGDAAAARLLEFDKNKDGALTSDELPERMLVVIERMDVDKDGRVTKEEIIAASARPATQTPAGRDEREDRD